MQKKTKKLFKITIFITTRVLVILQFDGSSALSWKFIHMFHYGNILFNVSSCAISIFQSYFFAMTFPNSALLCKPYREN